jgi:hypothetical protein
MVTIWNLRNSERQDMRERCFGSLVQTESVSI